MAKMQENWRDIIADRLRERNKNESARFADIIHYNNRLFDTAAKLRQENLDLKIDRKIRDSVNVSGAGGGGGTTFGTDVATITNAQIQSLEKKVLAQQEELTDLHKRKGEHSQMVITLNQKLTELQRLLAEKERALADQTALCASLKEELDEMKASHVTIKDESLASQLRANTAEDKLRAVQDENTKLLNLLMEYKSRDAEIMNKENDKFVKEKKARIESELERAIRDIPGPSSIGADLDRFDVDGLPEGVEFKFDAHDGEVNAVRWSPIERIVATGGADRKVKLWDVGKGVCEQRGVLVGSNQGINSVEFDTTGSMILAASNDSASRMWSVVDHRLRHTLTGHSGKVLAAKFLGSAFLVTGSHDRTLKIWDLKNRSCTETKFAGSSCNDLVTTDSFSFISGHVDKKIRFWDVRTADCTANDIPLQGKITSLDLSKDGKFLLSCVRDDTINLLDLRQNRIVRTFRNDNFKVGCDWSRVAFSPSSSRIAAGSADGSVYIWNINGPLETVLKDPNTDRNWFFHSGSGAAVTAVSWHPFSSTLASVDRAKKCTIWSNA
ncbi:autophagy-related protein 16-1 isoform X1 [Anopheles arabiensis]|uniref:autophagy-related protein 16-1 isoform X1 n=1 Tax=Anopheles arabiensis TaxID=7173 RepID=UPI001AAC5ABD|nr:autophagy-related protein 16-1 isoform X1 [Anopheles arabiensis]XP_041767004.1 autophagy-related protein 16-1 isoform X1 [Anopheles merus]